MIELMADTSHAGWQWHDFYWAGACIFIMHFLWLSPATLKQKNVLCGLVVMTALWPVTYTLSILQIVRLRRLKP